MSMMESFFSIKYAGRSDLFEGLSVWTDETYRGLQGSYPVISLFRTAFTKKEIPDSLLAASLNTLSMYLERHHHKKVLIFLDEYDTPLQEAYIAGYWKNLTELVRSLFHSTFKTNGALYRAVMTGITRVSKESIFSGLNHLEVITTGA